MWKKNSHKITPISHDGYVETKQYGRKNGWNCPMHPLQIVGWFFIVLFAVTHFSILVLYLPMEWKAAGIIIPAGCYIVHLVYHMLALSLDPADPAVRLKGKFVKESFDRNQHSHVIEDFFCYICQTKVSSQSKHCSICNKCVSEFDHHCKWLNNCVGGRNYKLFLGCCISGFFTAFTMFVIDFYIMILYYFDRSNLLSRSGNTKWILFVSTCKEAFIIFDIVNGLLLLIVMLLLGHLLIFHGYLLCHHMTTYEYIVRNRQQNVKDVNADLESACEVSPSPPKILDPLTSGRHGDRYAEETYHKNAYELNEIKEVEKVKNGHMQSRISLPGAVIDENIVLARNSTSNLYETPYEIESKFVKGETSYENKKKRRLKHRSSSQVELLKSFDREEDERSLSSLTTISQQTNDSELERYKNTKDEMVLEDFTSPNANANRLERISRPARLTEESTVFARDYSRNESVVSRPGSPTPQLPLGNMFVETHGKTSQSSLSTLNLVDLSEDGKKKSPRLSTMNEEDSNVSKSSAKSKKSSPSQTATYIDKKTNVEEQVIYSKVSRVTSPPQSLSSQLSLSNARHSQIIAPFQTSSAIDSPLYDEEDYINSPIDDSGVSTTNNDAVTPFFDEKNTDVEHNYKSLGSRKSTSPKPNPIEYNNVNAPHDVSDGSRSSVSSNKLTTDIHSKPSSPLQSIYTLEEGRVKTPSPVGSARSRLSQADTQVPYDTLLKTSLLSSPISSETKLTTSVPEDEPDNDLVICHNAPVVPENAPVVPDNAPVVTNDAPVIVESTKTQSLLPRSDDLILTNVNSEDENLIFEDEFVDLSEQNNDFLYKALTPTNAVSNSISLEDNAPSKPVVPSSTDNNKIASYVDAFKRKTKKQSSQYSYGSDSERSETEVPIARLNEETDTYALKDSLNRVKKLSDAFPSAIDQDRMNMRTLPQPSLRTKESMAEIQVSEYNKKKKLRKKRPGAVSHRQKNLPPLRGKNPLPDVSEETDKSF